VQSLAVSFDGDPKTAEEHLNVYARHCLNMPADEREQCRRDLIKIIGGLAQLHSRLGNSD
jgi:hypothetical protein